jgi:hypothetical protein
MNTAYILAIIWGALAVLALLATNGKGKAHLVVTLVTASAVSSVLGVAIQYGMVGQ